MHTILRPIEKQDHTLKLREMGDQIFVFHKLFKVIILYVIIGHFILRHNKLK